MEVIGYIASIIMGIVLGSIGGGGSILTVPILVYLMGVTPSVATGYSLLIVGLTAALGSYRYYRQGLVNLKPSITFAIPSIIAVYLTRAFLMPAIPAVLLTSPIVITKDVCIMIFFASLMLVSAFMMLRNSRRKGELKAKSNHNIALIILEGAVVGVVTGMLGAGGGFLIIPALVLLMGMPMKEAVGSSLLIIALKSLIGFIGDLQSGITIQMPLIPLMIVATLAGMLLATKLSARVDGKKLQGVFAYFTLVVAVIIIFKELT